jgi:hypothetical protein
MIFSIIPDLASNDLTFFAQAYWRGAVWPPLNFLVYLGLRNYESPRQSGNSGIRNQVAKDV